MDINLLTFTYPINGQYISKRLSLLEIYEKKNLIPPWKVKSVCITRTYYRLSARSIVNEDVATSDSSRATRSPM